MNVLVTGASGFIGSFLVEEAVRRGMTAWAGIRATSSRAYLRDEHIHFVTLNLEKKDLLREQLREHRDRYGKWDYIIHCAGVTKCRNKADFDRINFDSTRSFAELLTELDMVPRQFIYISSLSVYGPVHEKDYRPITENDEPKPDTAYGLSKLKSERYIKSLADFPYVIFRPTGVYGPRERDYFMMAQSVKRHVDVAVGFRRQVITFIYVKDLVQAVYRAIDKGVVRREYFVNDGFNYDSRAFSDLLQKELGVKTVVHITFPLFVLKTVSVIAEFVSACLGKSSTLNRDKYKIMKQRNWQCDIAPLVDELGFKPEYDLARGVKESIAWYKKEKWL